MYRLALMPGVDTVSPDEGIPPTPLPSLGKGEARFHSHNREASAIFTYFRENRRKWRKPRDYQRSRIDTTLAAGLN
jgi:hypothetical protein